MPSCCMWIESRLLSSSSTTWFWLYSSSWPRPSAGSNSVVRFELRPTVSIVSASTSRRSNDTESPTTLIRSFVTLRTDYCKAVITGTSKATINKLQRVLNAAMRYTNRLFTYLLIYYYKHIIKLGLQTVTTQIFQTKYILGLFAGFQKKWLTLQVIQCH